MFLFLFIHIEQFQQQKRTNKSSHFSNDLYCIKNFYQSTTQANLTAMDLTLSFILSEQNTFNNNNFMNI